MIRAAALLAVLSLSAACVTETTPAKKIDVVTVPTKPKEDAKSADDHELRLQRALIDLDQNVDRFAGLAAEPGDEARDKRNLLHHALTLQVSDFKKDLLAMAVDPSNPVRRTIAVKALGFCDDERAALPPLMAALTVKDDVRLLVSATYALGRLGSRFTDPGPLLDLVKDPDSDVRSNALLALWRVFDAKSAVGGSPLDSIAQRDVMLVLEPALFDPADPLIRAHAAAALGALGDRRAVDPIINLLRDEHPLVRMQAAIALSKLGDLKAVPALVKAIDAAPPGSTRHVVVLAVAALLERHGYRPPENLGDDSRMWERYVGENVRETTETLQK